MQSMKFLIFVAVAFCCWGLYGPMLHQGQILLGEGGQRSLLRPFICVGIAYFLIAVLFPLFVLYGRGERGHWSLRGSFWAFFAGCLGALGAFGIVIAFKYQGDPMYVMPLVFGGAPVINTVVSMTMNRTIRDASVLFYIGVVVVAIGAAGVMYFKPSTKHAHSEPAAVQSMLPEGTPVGRANPPLALAAWRQDAPPAEAKDAAQTAQDPAGEQVDQEAGEKQQPDPATAPSELDVPAADSPAEKPAPAPASTGFNFMMVLSGIVLTALCWGAYGPVLHKGQADMGQSRFRPFLCVGLAYFALAVLLPILLMPSFPEPGSFQSLGGIVWSLLGGAAGAGGALGIIYAFNFGGKPVFVMPLVFGCAPVINTFTEISAKGLYDQVSTAFYLSLALVIFGAVTVLTCAPKGHAKPAPAPNK